MEGRDSWREETKIKSSDCKRFDFYWVDNVQRKV